MPRDTGATQMMATLLLGMLLAIAAAPPVASWPAAVAAPPAVKKLRASALQRLPTGKVQPAGWLKDELTLQARGISGYLPYFWHFINASDWAGGRGSGNPHQYVNSDSRPLSPSIFFDVMCETSAVNSSSK